jgi:6-phosphogluconolactonase (cycloisomerase 2 family)
MTPLLFRRFCATVLLLMSFAVLECITSSAASAADITFLETLKNGVGGVNNLFGASDVAVAPDGLSVYVAAYASSSVGIFSREPSTGNLTFTGSVTSGTGGAVMVSAFAVDVSPDGKQVYVGSPTSNSIVAFSRDPATGALTLIANYVGSSLGIVSNGYIAVSVSPDGKFVYGVTGNVDGLVVFSRDATTGALTFVTEYRDGVNGNLLGQGFSPTASPINNVAVTTDLKFLYITSTGDNAVSVFARDVNAGTLTLASTVVEGTGGVDGIQGASSLVLSPDNHYLYVSGQSQNSVAVFSRNTTTGALTYLGKKTQSVGGITTLDGARSLAVSPDGRYVYVSAITSNAITVFNRDASTGDLTLATSVTQGQGGVDGIGGVSGMVTDPLSQNLYAAGQTASDISVFSLPVPAVVLSTTTLTVDENGPSALVDAGLSVYDADNTTWPSARIVVASGFVPGDLLSVTTTGNITASYNVGTGVLSLTGTDTLASYQAVMRSTRFQAGNDPTLNTGSTRTKTVFFEAFDGVNTSADATVTVTVNGISGPPSYTLTYSAGANGSITGSSPQTVIAGSSGSAVTAAPNAGYHFVQWSDGSVANPRTDTSVNADLNVSASFAINSYTVTSVATGAGTINSASISVSYGDTATFTLTPTGQASILSVQGCGGTLAGNIYTTGAITADCTVNATFVLLQVTVATKSGGGGAMDLVTLYFGLGMLILRFRRRLVAALTTTALVSCSMVLFTASPGVQAQSTQTGWYAGGSVGRALGALSESDLNTRLAALDSTAVALYRNRFRTAWNLHAGYWILPYVGVEAAYLDLGTPRVTFSGMTVDPASFLSEVEAVHPRSAAGGEVVVLGRYPLLEQLALTGKAGVMHWKSKFELGASDGSYERVIHRGTSAVLGAGLEYTVSKHWRIALDWSRYQVDSETIQTLEAGLDYQL